MTSLILPALFAVFVWWFSTGLVLMLDGLPHTTFRWSLVLSTALALAAFVGLGHTAQQTTPAGAFCAFTCALLLWGWHELSFLTGWVTGPRRRAADRGARGRARFVQAVAAILWHELGILAAGLGVLLITWRAPNQVGMQTFAVLWVMRISAKLNLFLGVRNLSTEFLPPHLAYLASYFRRRAMNLLFPLAVSAAMVVATLWVRQALLAPPGSARAIGSTLVATLLALAILEHWLLVLPIQATALWRWAMRTHEQRQAHATARRIRAVPPLAIEADENLLHAR